MNPEDGDGPVHRREYEARHDELVRMLASLADEQLAARKERSILRAEFSTIKGWIQGATVIAGIMMIVVVASVFHAW